MNDSKTCPICNNKFKNKTLKKFNLIPDNPSDYIQRNCSHGLNHSLQIYLNLKSKKIDKLKTSLNKNYSRYFEIDFVNNKSKIYCLKNSETEIININRIIEPDFPNLTLLKHKVECLVNFM